MTLDPNTLKLCNCNRTMALDGKALAAALALEAPLAIHTELCRKEIGRFSAALGGGSCVVACTQEAPLFNEVAAAAEARTDMKFINIRELAGWSAEGDQSTPKIAALLALAELPEPEPVPAVEYRSGGDVLIIGPAAATVAWAERLLETGGLQPSVLITDVRDGDLPAERRYPVWSGTAISIAGHLGAFEVEWAQHNPIDLEVCTRCNACVRACPENAIDFTYQVDLSKCASHRACVSACGAIGAIDFDRAQRTEPSERARQDRFDLILDLSASPILAVSQKPQGYLAPGRDPLEQALAAGRLAQLVGEFEKPKFFAYNERLCAHGRSGKRGCTNCIDVCSTGAIMSAGDKVRVEPHLCLGCGGCASVCPSGAMTHAYPRVTDLGVRLKRLLAVYHGAGGKDAALLFHNATDARALIHRLGRRGKGLPARVIPIEVHHIASIGIDVMLGAMAYGASQVLLLSSGAESAEYGPALEQQMGHAQTIVNALGYDGRHFRLVDVDGAEAWEGLEAALWPLLPARTVAKTATFNLSGEKRNTLEFAVEHLARHAPSPRDEIKLGSGAPYGRIEVNPDTCTLCKACIGACPAGALIDSQEAPRLRLIERNCVQCGLCATTCPENAITLEPRLLLTPQVKEAVTLNEAEPFDCVRCGKPFGTRSMIAAMTAKLGGHSMFAGALGMRRLQMCADCRVVDMMENKGEASIHDVKK